MGSSARTLVAAGAAGGIRRPDPMSNKAKPKMRETSGSSMASTSSSMAVFGGQPSSTVLRRSSTNSADSNGSGAIGLRRRARSSSSGSTGSDGSSPKMPHSHVVSLKSVSTLATPFFVWCAAFCLFYRRAHYSCLCVPWQASSFLFGSSGESGKGRVKNSKWKCRALV